MAFILSSLPLSYPTGAPHFDPRGRAQALLAPKATEPQMPHCGEAATPPGFNYVRDKDTPEGAKVIALQTGAYCIDELGVPCRACGFPLTTYPEYVATNKGRKVCGKHDITSGDIGITPLANYIRPKNNHSVLPPKDSDDWTNAWCELNIQGECAQGDNFRNYFYGAVTAVQTPGYLYDFHYCRAAGYLDGTVLSVIHDYDKMYALSEKFCAEAEEEFDVRGITMTTFNEIYTGPDGAPSPYEARFVRAWTCAMGGAGADMAYCAATYKDMGHDGFCMYPRGTGHKGYKGTVFETHPNASYWECKD